MSELKIYFENAELCVINDFKGYVEAYDTGELKSITFNEKDYINYKVHGELEINLKDRLSTWQDILYIEVNGGKLIPIWYGLDENLLQEFNLKKNKIEWRRTIR